MINTRIRFQYYIFYSLLSCICILTLVYIMYVSVKGNMIPYLYKKKQSMNLKHTHLMEIIFCC